MTLRTGGDVTLWGKGQGILTEEHFGNSLKAPSNSLHVSGTGPAVCFLGPTMNLSGHTAVEWQEQVLNPQLSKIKTPLPPTRGNES